MRFYVFLIALLGFNQTLYSQDNAAFQFEGNARFDLIGIKNHDNKKYTSFHGETDIAASVSSENLGLYTGGEIYAQVMAVFGNQSSAHYVGDLQVFSNIESDSRMFLYQCYYRQMIKKFIIKLGQLDMNSDFLVSSWAAPMVNSSFGVIPTISLNMPVSIFAYLSPGVSIKYIHSKQLTVQTAFFDGDPGNFASNPHNINWHFSKEEGWFTISELHYKTKSDLKLGRYKAGVFYHSHSSMDMENITSNSGTLGFFIIGDQQLTFERNTIKNGLSMFFQVSFSTARQNMIASYYSLGLIYRGIFPALNEDEFTVACSSARLENEFVKNNPGYYNNETALEITYKRYLIPSFIIQPDFQYIINPGANRLYKGNVTIGLLRTIITF